MIPVGSKFSRFIISPHKPKFFWQRPRAFAIGAFLILLSAVLVSQRDSAIANAVYSFGLTIHKSSWLRELLRLIRPFGKNDTLMFLAFLIGVRYRHKAVQILLSMILVGILVWPLKLTVERERPNLSNTHSFPSGDTAAITAFVVPIMAQSAKSVPLAAGLILAVGAIRIFDGVHYPSDVLAGICLGMLAASIILTFGVSIRRCRLRRIYFLYAAGIIFIERLTEYLTTGHCLTFMDFFTVYGIPLLLIFFARYSAVRVRTWKQLFSSDTSGKQNIRYVVLILAVLALVMFFFITARSTLWDRDEPRYAQATIEMVTSGNYLYPTFCNKVFPDKPILMYWLMSASIHVFGVSEFAARFFSPLATVIAVVITALIGRRLFSPFAGILAMAMLITTPMIIINGTLATTDAVLLAFIVLAISVFALSNPIGLHGSLIWLFFAGCLAGAMLTKGPIVAIPILVAITTLGFGRHFSRSLAKQLIFIGAAVLLAIFIFLLWFIPANLATGGEFLKVGIGHRVLRQTFYPLESHGGNFLLYLPYYLPVILCGFFPWTLYLPAAVSVWTGQQTWFRTSRLLLLSWILVTLCLMTLIATKLPHYILPCWPALALISAGVLDAQCRGVLSAKNILWLKRGIWLFVPAGFLFGIALLVGPWFLPMPGARVACTGAGIQILLITMYGSRLHRAGHFLKSAAILFVGVLLLQFSFALTVLPSVETFKVSPRIARAIYKKTPSGIPVAIRGYKEPSLVFYLQKSLIINIPDNAGVATWARGNGAGILVIPRTLFTQIQKEYGPLRLWKIAIVKGFNYSKGIRVDLLVLYRGKRQIFNKSGGFKIL